MLFVIGRRHQHVHVASEHLVLAIAEHPCRRRIERFDAAAFIDDDDAVDGRIDDGAPPLFACPQLLLDRHAVRQVVHHAGELALTVDLHLAD